MDSGDEGTVADRGDHISPQSPPPPFCPLAFRDSSITSWNSKTAGRCGDVTALNDATQNIL